MKKEFVCMYIGSCDETTIYYSKDLDTYHIEYTADLGATPTVEKTFKQGTTLEEVHKYIRGVEKFKDCVESEDYTRSLYPEDEWEEEEVYKEKIKQLCEA